MIKSLWYRHSLDTFPNELFLFLASNSTARCVFSSITLETRVLDIFYLNTDKSSAISVFELIITTANDTESAI